MLSFGAYVVPRKVSVQTGYGLTTQLFLGFLGIEVFYVCDYVFI